MQHTATITKPRIAFIGVGWIGRHRMEAAAKTGLADITVLCDPSDECIEEAKKVAPLSAVASSFDQTINDPQIDAVVIATPSAVHMQQTVAALQNNKAVFCQKPLGRNSAEVATAIKTAQVADKLLGADFSYRYTTAFSAIHNIIRSGELGEIYAIELKFHNAYGPGKPWFYDIQQSGGGCVLDLGVHMIDLALYALEFPEVSAISSRLYSKGNIVTSRTVVEDYADVMMKAGSVNAHLSCSWNLHAGTEAIIEASFYGTKGGVAIKNIDGSFYNFAGYRYWNTKSEMIVAPPDEWGGRAITDWLNRLSSSNRFQSDALNYYPSAQVIDRIYGIE